MPLEVPGSHESLVALQALEGPVTGVHSPMHGQVGWLPEVLATLLTTVRLHALMGPLVAAEARGIGEHAATARAQEGLLARMCALMALVGAELCKAFTTSRAAIGFLGCVDPLVAGEGRRSGETFPTLRAEEGALTRVGPAE